MHSCSCGGIGDIKRAHAVTSTRLLTARSSLAVMQLLPLAVLTIISSSSQIKKLFISAYSLDISTGTNTAKHFFLKIFISLDFSNILLSCFSSYFLNYFFSLFHRLHLFLHSKMQTLINYWSFNFSIYSIVFLLKILPKFQPFLW